MTHLTPGEVTIFQTKILTWYEEHKRDLPWRRTHDPYKILVSEVMLQQTQVSRVIPKYENWLQVFPTVEILAKATVSEVLKQWMGLGYNRRALYLQNTAREVVKRGMWPQTETELLTLPGIGKYTANALLCFAFLEQVAVVDTNVRKVILVEILKDTKNTVGEKEIEDIARKIVPKNQAYMWNQALMDYASSVLKHQRIPIPKQSRFKGSDRYYRAKILKLLLDKKTLTLGELGMLLREDYSANLDEWLENLLKRMQKDGLITIKNGKLTIV